eukprot:scpid102826/ scgid20292/ 
MYEFGQLPVLEMNGKIYSQSNSIFRMICQKSGYYPTNAHDAFLTESMMQAVDDLITDIYSPQIPNNADKKDEMIQANKDTKFPKFFAILEKRLKDNKAGDGKYLIGNKVTMIDMKVAGVWVA